MEGCGEKGSENSVEGAEDSAVLFSEGEMADSTEDVPFLFGLLLIGAALFLLYLASYSFHDATAPARQRDRDKRNDKKSRTSRRHGSHGHSEKLTNHKKPKIHKEVRHLFQHSWLLTTLRGHNSNVLDMEFSPNGKYLASCGEDRAVILWETQDWCSKTHRHVKINVKYDYPSLIRWSPDSKAFIIKRQKDNVVQAYKINKSKGVIRNVTPVIIYPRFHSHEIIGLGLSSNGRYIMTASNNTDIAIYDLKGNILSRFNSYVAVNYSSHLSPCSKYVIVSGFMPEARLWHVQFKDTGEFAECTRLVDLQGHTSGIHDTAFDAFSTKVATASKDGTWKLFDISLAASEKEPWVLASGTYEQEEVTRIALSATGDVIAIASGSSLSLFDSHSSKLDIVIRDIFQGAIKKVIFDAEGKYVLVCGDRQVRIFHNITGIKARAEVAKSKLKQPNNSSALNERLRQQISHAEAFLASFTS